jgi:glycosyltransferase involved in cell wall biosynthesis
MTPDITIFISCYNERETVVPTIETLVRALRRLSATWEMLVIDDCSSDDSVQTIERFQQSQPALPLALVRHDVNRGIGYSIFEAARLARGRYFWCVAGDNPVPEDTCARLFAQLGAADIIIPDVTRYVGRSLFRRMVSDVYGILVRLASGSKVKYFNGSSIYLREQFLRHADIPAGFGYSAEMITSLENDGCTYIEVPVLYNDHSAGTSTALNFRNFREVAAMLGRLLSRRLGRSSMTVASAKLISGRH